MLLDFPLLLVLAAWVYAGPNAHWVEPPLSRPRDLRTAKVVNAAVAPAQKDDNLAVCLLKNATLVDFLVIGDWGQRNEHQARVAGSMQRLVREHLEPHHPDFVIGLGDNFYVNAAGRWEYPGVKSVSDERFERIWARPFLQASLKNVPWYHVLGNHDWQGNAKAQLDYTARHEQWNLPSFMYTFDVDLGPFGSASFFFLDTNILVYGYVGEHRSVARMGKNFAKLGWLDGSGTIERQMGEIERALRNCTSDYVIVSAHHPTSFCSTSDEQTPWTHQLNDVMERNRVSLYLFGHKHGASFSQSSSGMGFAQVGNAVRTDALCANATFASMDKGYARGIISASGLQVQFINEHSHVLYTSPVMSSRYSRS